ncbi:MAG TPA: hypothetical protein VIV66_18085, partial [Pyrinomonadaceae bacterium]
TKPAIIVSTRPILAFMDKLLYSFGRNDCSSRADSFSWGNDLKAELIGASANDAVGDCQREKATAVWTVKSVDPICVFRPAATCRTLRSDLDRDRRSELAPLALLTKATIGNEGFACNAPATAPSGLGPLPFRDQKITEHSALTSKAAAITLRDLLKVYCSSIRGAAAR